MTFGPNGNLYVSQWGQQQMTVARFSRTGGFLREATDTIDRPMGHAWDDAGNLYVASFGAADVRRYTPQGEFIDVFIDSQHLQGPVNLWIDGDDLFVIDWPQGAVLRFDATTGEFLSTLVSGMVRAEGWAIGPEDGLLYVADWQRDVVTGYDYTTGASHGVFAQGGELGTPNGVTFAEQFASFEIAAADDTFSVTAGDEVTVEVTVTPDRDLPFDESVALSCWSLEPGIHVFVRLRRAGTG